MGESTIDIATRTVTTYNDKPRCTVDGSIVDAHEVCLELFEKRFYLYGTRYEATTGFTQENVIACYSSCDLDTWHYHGILFPPFKDAGLLSRPAVKYNAETGKYVLWFVLGPGCCVAIADKPEGPFDLVTRKANLKYGKSGDFNLFIDDDGTGYIIGTVTLEKIPGQMHKIYVEKLTEDYLSGTGEASEFLASNCEGPVLFKREGVYYALFDNTCCFCPAGSGARVYTAPTPFGPYEYRGDINRNVNVDPRKIISRDSDTDPGAGRDDVIIAAQQAQITSLPTIDGEKLIWIGDRWGSADDGVKGHDYTYWSSPLEFYPDGMIKPLQWEDQWTVTLGLA
jgi:hypothetical protein